LRGTVKWFNNTQRLWLHRRDDGPDVFVHYSAIVGDGYRTLQEGDVVEFEIVQGPKGPQAADVQNRAAKLSALPLFPAGKTSRFAGLCFAI